MTITFVFLLVLFSLRRVHVLAAAAVFIMLWFQHHVVMAQYTGFDPDRPSMPAAVLLGYLLSAVVLGLGRDAEMQVWENCCAVAGACYTLAAISKLHDSGLGWINDYNVRVVVAGLPVACNEFFRSARSLLIGSPALAFLASAFTLFTELSGVAMLFPRLRPYYAAMVLFMHGMIEVGMSINGYFSWAALIAVMSLPVGRMENYRHS